MVTNYLITKFLTLIIGHHALTRDKIKAFALTNDDNSRLHKLPKQVVSLNDHK